MKVGTLSSFLGLGSGAHASADSPHRDVAAVLATYTEQDHRRRLENIGICEQGIRKCMRKHLVTSYIPGQCIHNVRGANWEPGDEDEREFASFREHGIGIVQIWSRWASCWGGELLVPRNPTGIRRFVEMAHKYGLKVIPYTSKCFFERTDPHFKPEWAWPQQYDLVESDYHLAHCSPASPSWRAHVLPALIPVLDHFGFDGLYNDLGYYRPGERPSFYSPRVRWAKDEVFAFDEGPKHDGALADMLALIYEEVKRRGLIYKLHKEGADTVYTNLRIYDYLWVGEAVRDLDFLRSTTDNYRPYVVPERSRNINYQNEDELYLNSLPFMQFPMLKSGTKPGDEIRAAHARWLKQYLPMVEEGTWAWIAIAESSLFSSPLPEDVVVSAFANRELYLVIANYRRSPVEVATAEPYTWARGGSGSSGSQRVWNVDSRSIVILRRTG